MTDSENSQPQDDSDEDIYKDIPEFNFEDELAKLEGTKESYKQEANDLTERVKILTEENKELKKSNEVLKKNLSTLLKTAQAEIQRKDSMIDELRTKADSFAFRRNKKSTHDKGTSTEDVDFSLEVKSEPEKHKRVCDIKRSKSSENRTSSDSERKGNQEEEKRRDFQTGKEDNSSYDNYRKSGYYKRKFNRHEEDSSSYRKPYRETHRDYFMYDSFDKKKHSRSSDSRFMSRRRNSRERRHDRRRSESSERRKRSNRREESRERSRNRNSKSKRSRSRERSRGSKESSIDKPKNRISLDKDSLGRIKEQTSTKSEVLESTGNYDNRRKSNSGEKKTNPEEVTTVSGRSKQSKGSGKNEKKNSDMFCTKSPLDALYNDMVATISSNRFSNPKAGTTRSESDLEEGELSVTTTDFGEPSEQQPDEDWALSFKNERRQETKPMTLYSRRMMQKFSSESKKAEKSKSEQSNKEDFPPPKKLETEKEPGELTDDENIIESSKEFQELTKAAAIDTEIIEKQAMEKSSERTQHEQTPMEGQIPAKEETNFCKDIEMGKENRDVIEFSPFKNNYKLIEISPMKPIPSNEHVLDFYNQRVPPTPRMLEEKVLDSSEEKANSEKSTPKPSDTSEEKSSWKNSSSENNSEAELKIVVPSVNGSPKEKETKETKPSKNDEKGSKKGKTKKPENNAKVPEAEDNSKRKVRRNSSKKITEEKIVEEKSQKRKRKISEVEEGKSDPKKPKIESSRRSSRSKRSSKSEPEVEVETVEETEKKIKEDISSFEFFKPISKADDSEYKMTTSMSLTGIMCLETPNKGPGKLKNQMTLDTKHNSIFSPGIGSKSVEMTPRRMLKNDLMLTDSEDESVPKPDTVECEDEEDEEEEDNEEEEEAEDEEAGDEMSESENSECESDSGASDFVDLL